VRAPPNLEADLRGALGVADDAPVGFKEIRLHVDVETDASRRELDRPFELTNRYCFVFQTLQHSVKPVAGMNAIRGRTRGRWQRVSKSCEVESIRTNSASRVRNS
jgi:hypothetical protein